MTHADFSKHLGLTLLLIGATGCGDGDSPAVDAAAAADAPLVVDAMPVVDAAAPDAMSPDAATSMAIEDFESGQGSWTTEGTVEFTTDSFTSSEAAHLIVTSRTCNTSKLIGTIDPGEFDTIRFSAHGQEPVEIGYSAFFTVGASAQLRCHRRPSKASVSAFRPRASVRRELSRFASVASARAPMSRETRPGSTISPSKMPPAVVSR